MSSSNVWAEFAAIFSRTRSAHLEHEQAKAELKSLMPEDAQQAIGHGVRARRSKSGAISFDLLKVEDGRAMVCTDRPVRGDPFPGGMRQNSREIDDTCSRQVADRTANELDPL